MGWLREARWIVAGRRLLGRSRREAAVGRLVKRRPGPCHLFVDVI
jgi:hypothetical protein